MSAEKHLTDILKSHRNCCILQTVSKIMKLIISTRHPEIRPPIAINNDLSGYLCIQNTEMYIYS